MSSDKNNNASGRGGKSGMNIDTALVRELAELLNETGLTEIEVEDDDRKIRVARGGMMMPAQAMPSPAMAVSAAPAAPNAAAPAPLEPPAADNANAVKSPMV
jgi:acetyl-CoA carboxylase biotin carboxyl carrier protein